MSELSFKTRLYLICVYAIGGGILVWQLSSMRIDEPWVLAGLCLAAALAAVFTVEGATNRSHYTLSFLLYGFALVLLGLPAALTVIAVSMAVDWLWKRMSWFVQLFNATCYILVMYVAHLVYASINPGGGMGSALAVLGLVAAMVVFTLLNHLLVGMIVLLARGESFRDSGVFDLLPLMIDMTLLSLGGILVIVWDANPYALVLFSLPLYLIYSTLRVPSLERQTETDSKTGLFNHGYFMQQLDAELKRANRFDRPLAVIMADVDLLRNINNTYGHLAGDEVLIRLAALLKQAVREYDVVARFGGEEFSILMPETTAEQAYQRAESLRQAVEDAPFDVSTSVTPIRVTISVGIAGRESFTQPAEEIMHNADTALYHSKLKGRNRTYACTNQTYARLLPDVDLEAAQERAPHLAVAPVGSTEPEEEYRAAAAVRVHSNGHTSQSVSVEEESVAAQPESKPAARGLLTTVHLYIGGVTLAALLLSFAVSLLSPANASPRSGLDWLALAVFALLVVLTEWLSVDLYVKNTSVSTSAVPILAGTLIYGVLGAVVMSAAFAITALIKYRSAISRLFFNFGNQLAAAMIYTGLIAVTGKAFTELEAPAQLGICLAASVIVYLVTTLLVAIGVSIDVQQSPVRIWTEQYGWLIPSYLGMGAVAYALIFAYRGGEVFGIILMVVPLVLLRLSQKQYVDRTRVMVNELHVKQRILETSSAEIRALNDGLLDTLAEVIDLGDPYVLGHSMRVADLATRTAAELGLHDKQIDLIRSASMLHDIGKLGVPASILSKPARLTPDEYETVKKHVSLGAALLQKSRPLRPLAPIIGAHHEHFDGRGYPGGIRGKQIPIEARIIAVSDAVETMASDRPYTRRMPVAGIVEELRRCCGTQFDPLVVEAAIHVLRASDPPPVGPVAESDASPEEHIVSGVSHPVEMPE